MMELMWQGGYVMWVILVITILIAVLGVKSWLRTRELEHPDPVLETSIDAILVFAIAALAWMGLRSRYRRATA